MKRSGERGSTMVETAIVILLALTLIFGIVEFGRAIFAYHAVSNIARMATRYAIVHGANCIPGGCTASPGSVQQFARSQAVGLKQNRLTTPTVTWTGTALDGSACGDGANEKPGCTVTITVQYPFDFVLPYLGPQLNMSSTSQMVVAN
jgi:Flp pilus assembly protein TadG